MSKHRLVNCEFINAGSFKVNVSNKGKLLYLLMFTSADDRGFVDTTQDIINALEKNDRDFTKTENLSLLEDNYTAALQEIIDKGYIYEFKDNHSNRVHLIRHWFYHNKLVKGLWTNYKNFLKLLEIKDNEYILASKKPLKEDNIKENNVNEDNINEDNIDVEALFKKFTPKEEKEED